MTEQVLTAMRLEPALITAARESAGLPPETPKTHVIRYALALLAGRPDARAEMTRACGPRGSAVA